MANTNIDKGIIRNGELVMKRPTAGRLVHDHTAKASDILYFDIFYLTDFM